MSANSEKPEMNPALLRAAGQSCLAMATAIASFLQKDRLEDASELSTQLLATSRLLCGLLRTNRAPGAGGFTPIDTKGIELALDSPVCQYLRGFLKDGERKAVDVIRRALSQGHTKNEVFKAKEMLDLQVREVKGNKWWSLTPDRVSSAASK